MIRRVERLAVAIGIALLSACATSRDLVVVVPETNGHVGAVVVRAGGDTAVLDKGYAAATPSARSANRLAAGAFDASKVNRVFGDSLTALPPPPLARDIRFDEGSATLTPEAIEALRAWLDPLIKGRKAVEIILTGHTDKHLLEGAPESFNDKLSLDRAESTKIQLIPLLAQLGVVADSVVTQGRGSRDVKNAAGPAEDPSERYVEITIR